MKSRSKKELYRKTATFYKLYFISIFYKLHFSIALSSFIEKLFYLFAIALKRFFHGSRFVKS